MITTRAPDGANKVLPKLSPEFFLGNTFIYLLLFRKYTKDKLKCFQEPWKCYTRSPQSLLCFIVSNSIAALCNVVSFFRYLREPVQKLRILCSGWPQGVCVCLGLTISIYENVDFFCAMGPHFKKYLSGALPATTNLLGGLQVQFKIATLIFLSWSQSQCVIHEKCTLVSSQTLHTCTWSPPNYSFAGSLVTARVKCLRWEHLEIFQFGEYKGEAVIKSLIGDINNCLTHF